MNSMIKMLVVDDEPDVEALFTQRFRKEVRDQQVRIHFAFSGEQALQYLRTLDPFDLVLVLSDINMPGMTGDEVANVLSEDEATRDIPIVYLTALLEPGGTGLLDDSFGGHWGVSKSAPLGELLRVIARALQ